MSNLGFSILIKDSSTCSWGSCGVEPATFPWLDDPLSLQSNIMNQPYEKAYKNICEILLLLENQIG